jgi:hypothetical protein
MPMRGRFSPGHHQRVSMSPVTAIADMVGPVVLITVSVVFGNGLLTASIATRDRMFGLNRERLGILRGPNGELLHEDGAPPADRERLVQIRNQMPLMIRRIRHLRTALLLVWASVGVLVLSVIALAVAVTARSEAFAFTALALVIAGVTGVFGAVAAVIAPAARSATVVLNETRRTEMLD